MARGVDDQPHAAAMADVLASLGARTGGEAGGRFIALMQHTGLESSLTGVGVSSVADREAVAAAVNSERLENNPVALTPDELREFVTAMD